MQTVCFTPPPRENFSLPWKKSADAHEVMVKSEIEIGLSYYFHS